jgi:o-succinylbenzoate---CoA ligase
MAAVESDEVSSGLPDLPEAVWARLRPDWRVGLANQAVERNALESEISEAKRWVERVCDRRRSLESHLESHLESPETAQAPPLLLIAESDPVDCLAYFWAAVLAHWDVAFANPHWGVQEWQSVGKQLQPTLVWGNSAGISSGLTPELKSLNPKQFDRTRPKRESMILIPTGGSSGQVKFACHTWASLMASVSGFRQYFTPQGEPVNACCVLPVYHVSGLMQVFRAWLSNGQVAIPSEGFAIAPFKQLMARLETPTLCNSFQGWFISLVPTQLEQLLQANQGAWLSQFQAILLGGAPPWPTLLARAAAQKIPLCLSYGMTETAAMVTALAPADFLQGQVSSGRSLPHATLHIVKSNQPLSQQASQPLSSGEIGQIVVRSAAVAQRYYGDNGDDANSNGTGDSSQSSAFSQQVFYTDDLGYLSADGHLHITGRASDKIISGGENIFPAEVEAAIRNTRQVQDVCVIGWPHPHWGEAVIAVYVPISPSVCAKSLQQALIASVSEHPEQHPDPPDLPAQPTAVLSRYKHPKYWLPSKALPRNAQGKLNRQQLLAQLHQHPLIPLAPLSSPLAKMLIPDDGDRAS